MIEERSKERALASGPAAPLALSSGEPSSEDRALVPATSRSLVTTEVELPDRDAHFARHLRSWGRLGAGVLGMSLASPLILALAGGVSLGVVGAAAGLLTGGAFLGIAANFFSSLGNRRLEEALRHRLGASNGEFVGVSLPKSNRARELLNFRRLDTDDNVGFLTLHDSVLRIRMEGSTLELPREGVHRLSRERSVGFPFLFFIRIDAHLEDQDVSILVMSRSGSTARMAHRRNEELYEKLVEWQFESVLSDEEKQELGLGKGAAFELESGEEPR